MNKKFLLVAITIVIIFLVIVGYFQFVVAKEISLEEANMLVRDCKVKQIDSFHQPYEILILKDNSRKKIQRALFSNNDFSNLVSDTSQRCGYAIKVLIA